MNVKITATGSFIPKKRMSTEELEAFLVEKNKHIRFIPGTIDSLTGIKYRRYADDGIYASDLAAAACKDLFQKNSVEPDAVDMLIFASATQDLIEPATANIVQEKIGTHCPVFDVKNACNSFLNGVQVAEALIMSGQYKNVLIAVGETPSRSIKWNLDDKADFKKRFAGFTFGDAGAAVLLTGSESGAGQGVFFRKFQTLSRYWAAGTLASGGSVHPRGDEHTYFSGDGGELKDAFLDMGPELIHEALDTTHTTYEDYKKILVHQVSVPFLKTFIKISGAPEEKIVATLPDNGNMAAASMPVGLDHCLDTGELEPGDKVMFVGLAGGISIGVILAQL
jgi:3-oxoacyl-(acyl-carrier-protein) synthase III